MKKIKTIFCIGAGYVGGPTMAIIADKCPDIKVIVADVNQKRIDAWNSDTLPIYEPGLDEVVRRVRGKNLFFTTDLEGGIQESEVIFVSVNTPTKQFGEGAGRASDLQFWEKSARLIISHSDSDKIVVEKSTLPVRAAEAMNRILSSNTKGLKFDVLSNPEFLAEGTAIADLYSPDRVLIGAMPGREGTQAMQLLADIYANWVPRERIILTNVWSSELAKLVSNAMLAQRISAINSISAICEATGADVSEVSRAVGLDKRIGARFLNPGVGFGGSCFQKDILNLSYLAETCNLQEVAEFWVNVVKINDFQERRFVQRIVRSMFNTVAGKRIALFGFAFKADTGDTRESPAFYVTKMLFEERAHVAIHDPEALENAKLDLVPVLAENPHASVSFDADPYEAVRGAHALAVVTDWKCFRELDFKKIYDLMDKPAFLFDGRNILDHEALYEIGFNVYPIGRAPMSHLDKPVADS